MSINVAAGNRYTPLESILYSTQYLKSWTSGGTLKCENAIGKIKDIDLPVSITEHKIITAKQHANVIAYYIGWDLFDTSGISDILNFVNACESTSVSENLRILAEFECKTIVCTADGKIQLKTLGNSNAVYADYKHMYDKPEAKAEQLCGGVDVILYKYTYGAETEMKSVEIDVNGSTEYFIAFESPHHEVAFCAETLEGNAKVDEIYSGGSVGMTAYLSGAGKVKITPIGKPVLTEKKTISVNNPKASNKSANRITVDNPCVVTLEKARQIANYKSDKAKALATALVKGLNAICPVKSNRSASVINGMLAFDGAGYGEIRSPMEYGIPSVLVETNFHDNIATAQWIIDHTKEIAQAIVEAVVDTFGLIKSGGNASAPTTTLYEATAMVNDPNAPLNVRKGPNVDYNIIGGFANKQKIEITGKCNNGWYQVNYGGSAGYVNGELLTSIKPVTYKVQVGAYTNKDNAEAQAEKLKKAGYDTYIVRH